MPAAWCLWGAALFPCLLPRVASGDADTRADLPIIRHSAFPLIRKEYFRPAWGTGTEQLPEPVRRLLLPTPSPAHNRSSTHVRGVSLSCGNSGLRVRVYRRALGPRGDPTRLLLGTCQVNRVTQRYLTFHYPTQQCGGARSVRLATMIIDNRLVFSNVLVYQADVAAGGGFQVLLQCHFNRFQYVYATGYVPQTGLQTLYKRLVKKNSFSLSALTAQWEKLAPLQGYLLGHSMFFKAKAAFAPEGQKLYIHTCFVTASPMPSSVPRFTVVDNYGCMVDSKRNHSRSRFISHASIAVLFQLDSFLFSGMKNQKLYLHCEMSMGGLTATPSFKSCTYSPEAQRWEELQGAASVCLCCDSRCPSVSVSRNVISSESWSMLDGQEVSVGQKTHKTFEEIWGLHD